MQLSEILGEVIAVDVDAEGALTVSHDGTLASLRTVQIAEGLEMVSLTQMLTTGVALNAELRKAVAAHTDSTMLGTVTLVEQPGRRADVMLRYNFPVGGLSTEALQTLVLMVLDTGAGVRRALADRP